MMRVAELEIEVITSVLCGVFFGGLFFFFFFFLRRGGGGDGTNCIPSNSSYFITG